MKDVLRQFVHWLRCGGGYGVIDPRTLVSECGFCGFVYPSRVVREAVPFTEDQLAGFAAIRANAPNRAVSPEAPHA